MKNIKHYSPIFFSILLLSLITLLSPFFGALLYKTFTIGDSDFLILKYLLKIGENIWIVTTPLTFLLYFLFLRVTFSKPYSIKKYIFLFMLIIVSLVLYYISYYYLDLELENYSNYIYSKYGLKTFLVNIVNDFAKLLTVVSSLSFFILLNVGNNKISIKNLIENDSIVLSMLSFIGICILIFQSANPFLHWSAFSKYPSLGYEDIIEQFDYVAAIKGLTDTRSNIIIPPQSSDWPAISNAPVVRYFLFPRTIISSIYISSQERANRLEEAYFFMIEDDSGLRPWPVIEGESNIIKFNYEDSVRYISLESVLDYSFNADIIKIYKIEF